MARGVKPLMSTRLRGEGVDAGRHHKKELKGHGCSHEVGVGQKQGNRVFTSELYFEGGGVNMITLLQFTKKYSLPLA